MGCTEFVYFDKQSTLGAAGNNESRYNADNIVIFPQTSTAKFIDVDSFQLTIHRSNKRILCPCTVGVPEFMAPEIARRLKKEKTDLENVDQDADNPVFNKYTDLYAMAYHIFAL